MNTEVQEILNKVKEDIDIEDLIKRKFTFKKVKGFYYIIDSRSGSKVSLNGRVFRSKGKTKLADMLWKLREGYRKQLEQSLQNGEG